MRKEDKKEILDAIKENAEAIDIVARNLNNTNSDIAEIKQDIGNIKSSLIIFDTRHATQIDNLRDDMRLVKTKVGL